MVSETVAFGIATVGLTVHTGRLLTSLEVTVQAKVTGLAKPGVTAVNAIVPWLGRRIYTRLRRKHRRSQAEILRLSQQCWRSREETQR